VERPRPGWWWRKNGVEESSKSFIVLPSVANATVITVALGKPSELGIKLSKFSMVAPGTVTFKVTNAGAGWHNFVLCAKPVARAEAAKNACAGKKTSILKHNQSAALTVALTNSGIYEFLCSVTGHAAAGMKGVLGVGVNVTIADEKTASEAGSDAVASGGGGGGTTITPPATGGGGSTTPVAEIGPAVGCPPGVTVRALGNQDGDGDETGTERDDQDGCV